MLVNIIKQTDSYKVSHAKQYPPNTEYVYSYFESRGGQFRDVVFFGLQYYIKKYLEGVVVTEEKIQSAKKLFQAHFGNIDNFNEKGWRYILEKCQGKLPIKIKAVPEGTVVGTRNVLMTVENTDKNCYWLTNYIETLLVQVWYPCTVATQSREIKKNILRFLRETGSLNPETEIMFKLHDFGYRGSTSQESAAIGGASHLLNFFGTDTIAALEFAMEYYNCECPGFSINASEHSTISSWGREHEVDAFRNMLNLYPDGLVACVSDTWDIYNACWQLWGEDLKEQILNRNGTLIIRPDSGDPASVCLKVINILGDKFGYTINEKGYKVLDPHVRIIQGDGINYNSIIEILTVFKENKWAAENIGFGSGGALLQKMDRDTLKFAFKCSSIDINGESFQVYKNPVTDPNKISKKGRLKLVAIGGGEFDTVPCGMGGKDQLEIVFLDGNLMKEYTFDEIRKNVQL